MPRTPDAFPGERNEESIQYDISTTLPANIGEQKFLTSSVSGSGLFVKDTTGLKKPIAVPWQTGQVAFAVSPYEFVAALPITSISGWLVNNQGILLVTTASS